MGASIGLIPTSTLVRCLDECLIPEDRETVLDLFVKLERRFALTLLSSVATKKFQENLGVHVVLKILNGFIKDEVILRLGLGIIEHQLKYRDVIMDFIKQGGLELLDKAVKVHIDDDYLRQQIPELRKDILVIGADTAMEEILRESVSLQLCQKCQETFERANRVDSIVVDAKIPRSCERVNRVLMFMSNYPRRKNVQRVGLDALLYFARNADALETLHETAIIPRIAENVKIFKNDAEIVWRCYMVLSLLASFDGNVAVEATMLDVHEVAVETYPYFDRDYKTQQQILWMFGTVLKWPRAKDRIHVSQACMDFFKSLFETRELLIRTVFKGVTMKDKFRPYKVVIPLEIRRFLRETKGIVRPKLSENEKVNIPVRQVIRKNMTPGPLFGTVKTEIFVAGEKGLLDEDE